MFWQIHEIIISVLTLTLSGLALYKLFGPSYPWEVIKIDQYLTELVENVTQGVENAQQNELPIPDIVLAFPELSVTFHAKSGSVSDMASLDPIDYNLVSKNKTSQVIELRTRLKKFQVTFHQFIWKQFNNTRKGKIVVSIGNNIMKTCINCAFVGSCVCTPEISSTVIDDLTNIVVTVRGAEDDAELTDQIKGWVINHIISNVKNIVENSVKESTKQFTAVKHLKCVY